MLRGIKTLDDVDFVDKRVLVRIDINSDVRNGKVLYSERFDAPIKTIKELQKNNARVVLIAHQGRAGEKDFISLEQHCKILKKKISKLKFVKDLYGREALEAISLLKPKEVLLLENIRFSKEETKYDENSWMLEKLAPLFDLYVNDAFSASHRAHTSIVGFPARIKGAIGRSFEKELKSIDKLNIDNALLIIGGVKPDDSIELIQKTKGKIMPTGYLGPIFIEVEGYKLGKQDEILKPFSDLLPKLRKFVNRVYFPLDVAVENGAGRRQDIKIEDLPAGYRILDVGKETIDKYCEIISKARSIFVKGLPGLCNNEDFSVGTRRILNAVAESKAYSVVGGGHTLTFLDKMKILRKKFGYISLSGGALMHYLAKGTLPGIEALRKTDK